MKFARALSLSLQLAATALLCANGWAHAAEWQKVLGDRNRTIEIDRASIFDSDRGTKVSWGRVVLSDAEAATTGFRTIKALNRYDCLNRSFFTIKRVYLDANERVIREESVADQTPVVVLRDSTDERMWREVCRPPGAADLEKLAEAASTAAVAAKPVPLAAVATPPVVPKPVAPVVEAKKTEVTPPPAAAKAPEPMPKAAPPAPIVTAPLATPPIAKPNVPAKPETTPAAMPVPSIRPNFAAMATNTAAAAAPAPANAPTPASPSVKPAAPAPATLIPAAAAPQAPAPPPSPPKPVTALPATKPAPPAPPTRTPPAATAVRLMPDEGWSYAGDKGPERWSSLRPDWKLCGDGKRQSPIDLRDGVAVELDPVKFDYRPTRFRITDTGNTLRVNVGDGMGMEVRGQRYVLESFTLHRPSQERVGGGASDMEVHFHHRSADGALATLGVLLERGEKRNGLLQTVLNNLPLEKGSDYMPEAMIDLAGFLPASPAHFL